MAVVKHGNMFFVTINDDEVKAMEKRDRFGREIKVGDLLKIPHFKSCSGRNVWMYKLVVLVDDNMKIDPFGKFMYCVDVTDIARNGIDRAFKCPLSVIDECEIIADASDGIEKAFWERKKMKATK